MLFTRRRISGFLCLVFAILIVVIVRIEVERPAPETETIPVGNTTFTIETDRTSVWQEGDCVTLQWHIEGIQGIWWSQGPTVGDNKAQWCVRQQVAIPFFTIRLQDGSEVNLPSFGIHTVRAELFIALIPLLLIVGWCFQLHLLLARLFSGLPNKLRQAFKVSGRVHPLLVVLFLLLNGIVIWNAVNQNSLVGYDSEGHIQNVLVLSQGRLPMPEDSNEFFSPPLPYALPALLSRVSGLTDSCAKPTNPCYEAIRKAGQLQNILVSLIASFVLLRIGARLHPDELTPRAVALFLLATLPVYYKSFAFLRGEPFVAMFTLLLCDYLLVLLKRPPAWKDAAIIGIYGGLILLSRQWGVFILIGLALWWIVLILRQRSIGVRLIYPGIAAGLIALVLGGWFYVALDAQTGTFLAFNRSADTTAKPVVFFTGLGGANLFMYPFSPRYDGQAMPIFYTEIWGDYFGYFQLQRPPIASPMPANVLSYMGRVNLVSLLPTLVLLVSLAIGVYQTIRLFLLPPGNLGFAHSLFTICSLVSLGGFVWFLIRTPSGDGDTAKATYILQIFPLVCLLAGGWLDSLKRRTPLGFRILLVLLVAVAVHNSLMYFSRIN